MSQNWEKILGGGGEDLIALVQKHASGIAKTYNDADGEQGVDINLKLILKPGKDGAVAVKSKISFTADRIKDGTERTVTDQGELFEGPEPQED